MAVEAALRVKGLPYDRVELTAGQHVAEMQRIYGEGRGTVPGLLLDGEPVHGSRAILARLEQLQEAPTLYPEPLRDEIREAEQWGDDEELQDLGRRLPWGALQFRPEAMGTFAGGEPLDGPAPTLRSSTYTAAGATTRSPPHVSMTILPGYPTSSRTSTPLP
ncbi:MAG: glutathione S-transferase N-terminal domain-containing protein, partial [Actinomycetota bacterium]|nr:glutathione S-transferase N-terminal domain-containing protein [Actinomycetota bacterium]